MLNTAVFSASGVVLFDLNWAAIDTIARKANQIPSPQSKRPSRTAEPSIEGAIRFRYGWSVCSAVYRGKRSFATMPCVIPSRYAGGSEGVSPDQSVPHGREVGSPAR